MITQYRVTAENDSRIRNIAQKSTAFSDELEACETQDSALKMMQTLAPTNSGQIQDIKFFPILLNYRSNYDDIRRQTRKNVIYFKNNAKDLHGDPTPFLSGNIYLIIHGFIDSIDSNTRIFGIGE